MPVFKTINESLTQSAPLLHAVRSQLSHGVMRCLQRRTRDTLTCPTEALASSRHCEDTGASTCGQRSPEHPPPKSKASGPGRPVALSSWAGRGALAATHCMPAMLPCAGEHPQSSTHSQRLPRVGGGVRALPLAENVFQEVRLSKLSAMRDWVAKCWPLG